MAGLFSRAHMYRDKDHTTALAAPSNIDQVIPIPGSLGLFPKVSCGCSIGLSLSK